MRQGRKSHNNVSACDVIAKQQVSQQALEQPKVDAEEVSLTPVQGGPLVSRDDAGQQDVLDTQLGGKVQKEPAAVSYTAPHSGVQDAETKTFLWSQFR